MPFQNFAISLHVVRIAGSAEVRPVNVSQSLRQGRELWCNTSLPAFLFTIIPRKGRSSFLNADYLCDLTLVIPVY